MNIILDFETRSRCDLIKRGTMNYAKDVSTEVLCCAFMTDDPDDDRTWLYYSGDFPSELAELIEQADFLIAWNVAFDRAIWQYVAMCENNFPVVPRDKWLCAQSLARIHNLPASLENAAIALDSKHQKDIRGKTLIRKLSIPDADGNFLEDASLLGEMGNYCVQDVKTTKGLYNAMRSMLQQEHDDWLVNERINARGVKLDRTLAELAVDYANAEHDNACQRLIECTGGVIESPKQYVAHVNWFHARIGEDHPAYKLTEVYKDGERRFSLSKDVRQEILERFYHDEFALDSNVVEFLECLSEVSNASAAKFNKMLNIMDPDTDRVYGAFVYGGAGQTMRFSSRGLQLHNLPSRISFENENQAWEIYDFMLQGLLIPEPLITLKKLLRHCIMAEEDNWLVVGDWKGIEARLLPWLSNSDGGREKLAKIASGVDVYMETAKSIGYDDRKIGKVVELACFGADTRVVTSNGIKQIVDVKEGDLLWDGSDWIEHQGVIAKGKKETINLCGVTVTPDHLIQVKDQWIDAKTVNSNENIRYRALATGSANLPFWVLNESNKERTNKNFSLCSVVAAQRLIWWHLIIYVRGAVHVAMSALKSNPANTLKNTTATPILYRMTKRDDDCLTVSRQRIHAVHPRTIKGTKTMVVEALKFIGRLVQKGVESFYLTWSRLKDLITSNWNWTELMLMETTHPATLDSSPKQKTREINVRYRHSQKKLTSLKKKSSHLNHVYDIVNAGPQNRFTIITNEGPLLVHNCGYGGAVGAFKQFARGYGVKLNDIEIEKVVTSWRRLNSWVLKFWEGLEYATCMAVTNPGVTTRKGRIRYRYMPTLLNGSLLCILPDDSIITYPCVRIENGQLTSLNASVLKKASEKEWPRQRLYGGRLAGHATQATAAALLRNLLRQLDNCVAHVHDEVIIECREQDAYQMKKRLKTLMTTSPSWASDLPLEADPEIMERYRK